MYTNWLSSSRRLQRPGPACGKEAANVSRHGSLFGKRIGGPTVPFWAKDRGRMVPFLEKDRAPSFLRQFLDWRWHFGKVIQTCSGGAAKKTIRGSFSIAFILVFYERKRLITLPMCSTYHIYIYILNTYNTFMFILIQFFSQSPLPSNRIVKRPDLGPTLFQTYFTAAFFVVKAFQVLRLLRACWLHHSYPCHYPYLWKTCFFC